MTDTSTKPTTSTTASQQTFLRPSMRPTTIEDKATIPIPVPIPTTNTAPAVQDGIPTMPVSVPIADNDENEDGIQIISSYHPHQRPPSSSLSSLSPAVMVQMPSLPSSSSTTTAELPIAVEEDKKENQTPVISGVLQEDGVGVTNQFPSSSSFSSSSSSSSS